MNLKKKRFEKSDRLFSGVYTYRILRWIWKMPNFILAFLLLGVLPTLLLAVCTRGFQYLLQNLWFLWTCIPIFLCMNLFLCLLIPIEVASEVAVSQWMPLD